jgi:hypothetical protein
MMRIGYLPSDFNPMLLMLGEAEDFRALSGVLRGFARHPTDTRLDTLGFCTNTRTAVVLTGTDGPAGVHAAPDGRLLWRIDPDRAARFAAQVDSLADPGRLAGSEMLECSTEEEIPVKLSRGEYTDDFLLPGSAGTR